MAERIHHRTSRTAVGLGATLTEYPAQAKLLEQIVSGEYFKTDELPDVPDHMRKPPVRQKQKGLFDTE